MYKELSSVQRQIVIVVLFLLSQFIQILSRDLLMAFYAITEEINIILVEKLFL